MSFLQVLHLSKKELDKAKKPDLIKIVKRQSNELKRLERENERLKKELEKKKEAKLNSEVNQPSSKKPEWDKDGNPKRKLTGGKKKRKRGKKKRKGSGNSKKTTLVPSEENHTVLSECPECGEDLSNQDVIEETTRVVEDVVLPKEETVISKETGERKWCPICLKVVSSRSEKALPGSDIGLQATVLMCYLWIVSSLSLPSIQKFIQSFMSMKLSTSGISKLMIRLSKILEPVYQEILENVRSEYRVWADETGWRIRGQLHWLWAFSNEKSAFYWVDKSRGSVVVEEILGQVFLGVLTSDAWGGYSQIVCAKQTCMAHIFRKIRKFIEEYPQYRTIMSFYVRLRRIIRDAEKLQKGRVEFGEMVFHRRLKRLRQRLSNLLAWQNPNPVLKKVIKKVRRQQEYILTFVEYEGVNHHNNYAEYIIKKGVLKRKISGGSMSLEGARAFAVLQSIAQTCYLRGISFHRFLLVSLVQFIRTGKPLLLSQYQAEQKTNTRVA